VCSSDLAPDLPALYARSRGGGFGAEVRRRILLGTFALSAGYHEAYYRTAQRARERVRREYAEAFAQCDVLLTPVAATPPFPLGERLADPLAMYRSDVFTVGANLAGIPALSVPVTPDRSGLPRAAQLLARDDGEGLLLRAARVLEVRGERSRLERAHETEPAWPARR
jgi:aspartyl-tRNA(Asn)/glutamyl-tRNA(Gln) amidotransferase subunit A